MSEFDSKANDWDKNNTHIERSQAIAKKMKEMIVFRPGMKAMEFGAGTALLSFIIQDLFSSITLVDNSQEMIRVCNEKIGATHSMHMRTLKIDLETEDIQDRFDIIYSQMAFHHISDVNKMIQKFYRYIKEDGMLAIADLFPEDGSFHGDGFTGHRGIDPEWLAGLMRKAGFIDIHYKSCFVLKKIETNGTQNEYPVFLITAKKPD